MTDRRSGRWLFLFPSPVDFHWSKTKWITSSLARRKTHRWRIDRSLFRFRSDLLVIIMQRLADYFLVVGYDHHQERLGRSSAKILQRFLEKDWPDGSFNPRIIHFCQAQGWKLSVKHELPTLFISIWTNLDGLRHSSACLTFHPTLLATTKTVSHFSNKSNGCSDEADDKAFLLPRTQMFATKYLVLTSKLDCFEAFR